MKLWLLFTVLFAVSAVSAQAGPVLTFKSKTSNVVLSLVLDPRTNTPIHLAKSEDFWKGAALQNPNLKSYDQTLPLRGEKRLKADNFVLQIYNPNTYSDYRFSADVVLEKNQTGYRGKIYFDFPSSNVYSAKHAPLSFDLFSDMYGNTYATHDGKFVQSIELVTEEHVSEIKLKGLKLELKEDVSTGRTERYEVSTEELRLF